MLIPLQQGRHKPAQSLSVYIRCRRKTLETKRKQREGRKHLPGYKHRSKEEPFDGVGMQYHPPLGVDYN